MMKKCLLIIIIIISVCMPVYAHENENKYYDKAESFITEYGIDFEKLKDYPFETLWGTAKETAFKGVSKPLNVFYKITAVLILTSFINLFASDNSKHIVYVINAVTIMVLMANIFESFVLTTREITDGFTDIKNFMTTFIPIFAGMSFASGEMITSTVYTGFFMISVVAVANFCINFIVPSLNLFLAVGITASLSPLINLKPLCELYSKAVKFAMTAAVSVLCFMLTIQTSITQSQDNLALKTGKMIVGYAVPIIGSALQSAVGSVYASMGVLKSFFGIAGVIVIINLFLPTIINLSVNWLGYYIMAMLGDMLENKAASELLSVFKETCEILISMSVLFTVLLIFSMTVMIRSAQGV